MVPPTAALNCEFEWTLKPLRSLWSAAWGQPRQPEAFSLEPRGRAVRAVLLQLQIYHVGGTRDICDGSKDTNSTQADKPRGGRQTQVGLRNVLSTGPSLRRGRRLSRAEQSLSDSGTEHPSQCPCLDQNTPREAQLQMVLRTFLG